MTTSRILQDISLSARILATFPDYVHAAQRVEDLNFPTKDSIRQRLGKIERTIEGDFKTYQI